MSDHISLINEMASDRYGTDPDLLDDIGGFAIEVVGELVARGFFSTGSEVETPPKALTTREAQILHLMVEGLNIKEIARRLGVAAMTVKVHRKSLYRKIGARHAAHAVSIALRTGLVPLEVVG